MQMTSSSPLAYATGAGEPLPAERFSRLGQDALLMEAVRKKMFTSAPFNKI